MIHLNIKYLNKLQKHLNILKIIEKCIAILGQKILNVHVIPAQEVKSFAASSLSLRSKCTYVCICHTTNTFISLSTREHFVANYFLRQKIILFDTVRKMLLIATKGEILTNRCTSADDLLQGLIEFILFCLPAAPFLSLSLSLSFSSLPYREPPIFSSFFFSLTSFIFSGSFVHPSRSSTLRSCILLKLETANGARFSLHGRCHSVSPSPIARNPPRFRCALPRFIFILAERQRKGIGTRSEGRLGMISQSVGPCIFYSVSIR